MTLIFALIPGTQRDHAVALVDEQARRLAHERSIAYSFEWPPWMRKDWAITSARYSLARSFATLLAETAARVASASPDVGATWISQFTLSGNLRRRAPHPHSAASVMFTLLGFVG